MNILKTLVVTSCMLRLQSGGFYAMEYSLPLELRYKLRKTPIRKGFTKYGDGV